LIKGEIVFEKDEINNTSKAIWKTTKQVFGLAGKLLASYIRTQKLTGGTSDSRLKVRSGQLRASVRERIIDQKGEAIEGGVGFGTVYAWPHVGEAGEKTIITPKRAKYLTIPLEAAMTPSGVAKGSALNGPWGDTFIAKSKRGNLIIFGRMKMYQSVKVKGTKVRGVSIRKMGNKIVPLFLLKKSVTIPARIHPSEILGWISPKMVDLFKENKIEVKG
jgi:hypothetical protein